MKQISKVITLALIYFMAFMVNASGQTNKTISPAIINIVDGSVHFVDADGNGVLNAGESGRIVFKVRNDGSGDGVGCRFVSVYSRGINVRDKVLPTIPAGKETEFEIPVTAADNAESGNLKVMFKVDEPNGFGTKNVTCEIPVQHTVAAPVESKVRIVAANLSQSIERRTPFTLEFTLKNIGNGPATNVSFDMSLPSKIFFTSGSGKQTVASLAPGESVVLKYNLIVNNDFYSENIAFEISENNGIDPFVGTVYLSNGSNTISRIKRVRPEFTVNGVKFKMKYVSGGTFMMGATPEQKEPENDEKPVHQVTLSSYWIGETEVTQALWQAVMGRNPSHFEGDKLPVESVSWSECQEFIKKLNELTGKKFRLPTEAEWEFAARGGNKSRGCQYSGDNYQWKVAWYDKNSNYKTHRVAEKSPNELGIYDMSGNVWEWCQDEEGLYSSEAQTNPMRESSGYKYVVRGGCWNSKDMHCRLANRGFLNLSDHRSDQGFRLALSQY